jgi:hypothetical protein
MANEGIAQFLEFDANVAEVVNLAVVHDPIATLGIVHGLVAKRGEVEDSETTVA